MSNSSDWEMPPNMEKQAPPSVVQEFYKDQKILLTGITGFIGQCLLERLIRCCNPEKIYTILRKKKGNSVEERMKQYYELPVFNHLREKDPNFMKKVVVLEGDLVLPDMGLSPESRRILTDNVTLIIHNAASVLFFHRISQILTVNVLGTQKVLELAKECSHLHAFMYISTAYSQSQNMYTEERCYPSPADMKMIHDIIAADTISDEGMSQVALDQCLDYCTNNYIFSKAITEGLVEEYSRTVDFPCGIFRPSIVYCAEKEPVAGWTINSGGPTLQFLAAALGVMHFSFVPGDPKIDLVPVDLTCNALITFVWYLATFKKPREKCHVSHYTSTKLNPTSLQTGCENILPYVRSNPTVQMVWYPWVIFTGNEKLFYVLHYLFHVLPAMLIDLYSMVNGTKPFIMDRLHKMTKNASALLKFATTDFRFETREWVDMWNSMNSTDKEIFYSDIRQIEWIRYSYRMWDYQLKNFLLETDEDLPKARRKLVKLKIIHYASCAVVLFIFLYFLYSLACRVLGL